MDEFFDEILLGVAVSSLKLMNRNQLFDALEQLVKILDLENNVIVDKNNKNK